MKRKPVWVQKLFELVSLHLDTQTDTEMHVYGNHRGKRDCSNWRNGVKWTGSHQVLQNVQIWHCWNHIALSFRANVNKLLCWLL
jgi:hypothetical protein